MIKPPPVAEIESPVSSALVGSLADVVITATDDNFAQWQLFLTSASAPETMIAVASQTAAVTSQPVYQFDPTVLTNGIYSLRLEALDSAGNLTTDSIDFIVDGNMKVGNFTYAVDEFTVPLAGLPISIVRTYDSRRKAELGDFGYGWNLDYNLVKTEKSRALGAGWQLNDYPSGPLGALTTFCVESIGDITVAITLPNDDVERFKVKANPECNEVVPVLDVELAFEPIGDTQSTLALKSPALLRLVGGNLEILGDAEVFDADNFVLTSREDYVYDFTAGGDVSLITDPNGNTLTFDSTGITHSSGKKITFSRGSNDIIRNIRTPDNHNYSYTYSITNDLVRARKPVFSEYEDYTYNYQHGLLDILDSLGRVKVKNIYDEEGRLIAQEDTDGNLTSYAHDIAGQQSAVTDRNGNITFYFYDDRGNVTSMVDALGEATTYTYDTQDNQLTETDPLGNITTRTFNAQNDLLTTTDPEGNVTTYTYNTRGQELIITDAEGNVYENTYDAIGNLLRVDDPSGSFAANNINAQGLVTLTQDMLGFQTSFMYDSDGNKAQQSNPDGSIVTFTYDNDNQVATESRTRALTGETSTTDTTTYGYDATGRVTLMQDSEGRIEINTYDALGNKTSESDGVVTLTHEYDVYNRLTRTLYLDGSNATYTYDPEGNQLTETDRNGNVTTHTYDKLNRVIKTTYADDGFIEMAYDAAGRMVSETDENGNTTTYAYDKAGRRTSMTDALGQITRYAYDKNDNLISETDALGRETTYEYDALDRRVAVIFEDATRVDDVFDGMGRNTSKADQLSRETRYAYDEMGRLTQVTDALNQVTQYEYDEAGNKVAQIDAEGRITRWEYDSRGRVTARVLPLGQRESFTYDLADNVKSHTNFNGQTLNYEYERTASRLVLVTGPDIRETYRYDEFGNRTYAKNHSGEYTYAFDSRNRLIEEVQPNGSTLTYTYDLTGNKTSFTIAYANGDSRTETYTYDVLNRLASVTDNDSQTTTFDYDAVGNQTHIRYANGLVSITAYDSLNRPVSVSTEDAVGNVLTSYTYVLDATGRRSSISEHSGRQSTFTYDDVYRLTNEAIIDPINGDHAAAYVYDKVGNRTQSTVNGVVTDFTYDDNDRLLTEGSNTYTHDAHGNLTTQSNGLDTKTYSYNANQRLMQVTDGVQTVDFEYNLDDIRVSKSVDGLQTDFIVDSNQTYQQVVAEQDDTDAILKQYVYGNDLISQNQSGSSHFYHYDSLGTTRALSDAAATISDEYVYEAFGELLGQTGTTDNNYLYTGEQFDTDLDNYYLRARYYNQNVGRFTQMDEFEGWDNLPISLNKYIYAHSDVINEIDPTGLYSLKQQGTAVRINAQLAAQSSRFDGASLVNKVLFGKNWGKFSKEVNNEIFGAIGEMVIQQAIGSVDAMLAELAEDKITNSAAAKGSRAHLHLKNTIGSLNESSVFKKLNLTVKAEIFRLPGGKGGDLDNKRPKGSLGLDIVIYRGNKKVLAFDLKTGRGWSKNSVDKRKSRFGKIDIVEIFVNKR